MKPTESISRTGVRTAKNPLPLPRNFAGFLATVFLALLALTQEVSSQVTNDWVDGRSTNWSVAAAWTNAPTAVTYQTNIIRFIGTNQFRSTNNLGGFLLHQLIFSNTATNAAGSFLAGDVLVFTNNGATLAEMDQNGSGAITISNNIDLASDIIFGGNGTGALTNAGNITSSNGTRGIIKTGTSRFVLGGSNTFLGLVDIKSGILQFNSTNAGGSGTNITLGGGELYLRSNATNNVTVTFGSGLGYNLTLTNTSSLSVGVLSAGGTNFFAIGSLIVGTNTLTVTNNNQVKLIVNGSTVLSNSTVNFSNTASLLNSNLILVAGTTNRFIGSATGTNYILNAMTFTNITLFSSNIAQVFSNNVEFYGSNIFNGNSAFTVATNSVTTFSNMALASVFTNLTDTNRLGGNFTFNGSNQFFGTNFFAQSNNIVFNGASTLGTNSLLRLANAGGNLTFTNVVLNGTNTFDFQFLALSGTNLTPGNIIIAGTISEGTPGSRIVKSGSGSQAGTANAAPALILTNNNSFTGGVEVQQGVLELRGSLTGSNVAGYNLTTNAITVSGGALNLRANTNLYFGTNLGYGMVVSGNSTTSVDRVSTGASNVLSLGSLALAGTTMSVTNGNNFRLAFNQPVTLTGNGAMNLQASTVIVQLNDYIQGSGATRIFTKQGAGTLILNHNTAPTNLSLILGAGNTRWQYDPLGSTADFTAGYGTNVITLSNGNFQWAPKNPVAVNQVAELTNAFSVLSGTTGGLLGSVQTNGLNKFIVRFSGPITISNGTLNVGSANAINLHDGGVDSAVNTGLSNLQYNGTILVDHGSGSVRNNTIQYVKAVNSLLFYDADINGNIIDADVTGSGRQIHAMALLLNGGTTLNGALNINGANNTYAGGTIVNGSAGGGFINVTTNSRLGSGAVVINPLGRLRLNSTNNVAPGRTVTVLGGGVLSLGTDTNLYTIVDPTSSGVLSIDNVNYTDAINLGAYGNGRMFLGTTYSNALLSGLLTAGVDSTYRLGAAGGTLTLTNTANILTGNNALQLGAFSNQFGTGNLTTNVASTVQLFDISSSTNGVGNIVLGQANDYTGVTIINSGTNTAAVAGALGTNAIIFNGGTLVIAAANAYTGVNGISVVPRGGTLATLVDGSTSPFGNSNVAVNVYGTLAALGANGTLVGLSNFNFHPGSTLALDSSTSGINTNRYGDSTPLVLNGATFVLATPATGYNTNSEIIGDVMVAGGSLIQLNAGQVSNLNTLTLNRLIRSNQGTLRLATAGTSVSPELGLSNRIFVTAAPGLNSNMVAPWIVNASTNSFMTYVAGYGLSNVIYSNVYLNVAGFSNYVINANSNAGALLTTNVAVYALRATVGISNFNATITNISGGLILAGNGMRIEPSLVFNSNGTSMEALIYTGGGVTATLSNSVSASSITKFGLGTLVMGGVSNSAYANGWNVNEGTLSATDPLGLGTTAAGNFLRLNGNATVQWNAAVTNATFSSGPITMFDFGNVLRISAANDVTNSINSVNLTSWIPGQGSTATLTNDNSRSLVASPSLGASDHATLIVSGPGASGMSSGFQFTNLLATNVTITKLGSGGLYLVGDNNNTNTFTNSTLNIVRGSLVLNGTNPLGAANSVINVASNAAFVLNAGMTGYTNTAAVATLNQLAGSAERWNTLLARFADTNTTESFSFSNGVHLQVATDLASLTNKTIRMNGGSIEAYLNNDSVATAITNTIGVGVTIALDGTNALIGRTTADPGRANATLAIDGVITDGVNGAARLIKIGADTNLIRNQNTYSGGTIITAGALDVRATNTLPGNFNGLGTGANVLLTGSFAANAANGGRLILRADTNVTFGPGLGYNISVSNPTPFAISEIQVNQTASNVVYSPNMMASLGSLNLVSNAYGPSVLRVQGVSSNYTLAFNGASVIDSSVIWVQGGATALRSLIFKSNVTFLGTNAFLDSRQVFFAGPTNKMGTNAEIRTSGVTLNFTNLTLEGLNRIRNNANVSLDGLIDESFAGAILTKDGTGTLFITNLINNTYTGGSIFDQGTVTVWGGTNATAGTFVTNPLGTGNIVLQGATNNLLSQTNMQWGPGSGYLITVRSNSVLNLDRIAAGPANQRYQMGDLVISNNAVLSLTQGNGYTAEWDSLTIDNSTLLAGGTNFFTNHVYLGGIATISNAASVSFNLRVSNYTSAGTLVKLGAGTLFLTNGLNQSYSGGTIINAGTVQVNGGASVANALGTGAITLNGGTLALRGDVDMIWGPGGGGYNVTVNTNATLDIAPRPQTTSATNKVFTLAGLTVNSLTNANLTVNQGSNYSVAWSRSSAFSNGTLTANATNTFLSNVLFAAASSNLIGGNTRVQFLGSNTFGAGTILTVTNNASLGTLFGDVGLGGAVTLNNSNTVLLNGIIADAGGTGILIKTGAGTLFVTNLQNSTYSGGTVINAGTVQLAGSATATNGLGTGAVTLNGGTLQLRSDSAMTFGPGVGYTINVASNATINPDRISAGTGLVLSVGNLNFTGGLLTNTVGNSFVLGVNGTLNGGNTFSDYTSTTNFAGSGSVRFNSGFTFANTNLFGGANAFQFAGPSNVFAAGTELRVTNTGGLAILSGTNFVDGAITISNAVTASITGALRDGVGAGSITKNGVGALLLTNSQDAGTGITGGLTVNGGAVTLAAVTDTLNLPAGTGTITLNGGAGQFNLRGQTNTTFGSGIGNALVINSNLTVNVDRIDAAGGLGNVLSVGNLTLGANILTVSSGNSYVLGLNGALNGVNTFNNFISATNFAGTGNLQFNAPWTFANTNVFSGLTYRFANASNVFNAGTILQAASAVTIFGGGTNYLDGQLVVSNASAVRLSGLVQDGVGTGQLVKTGSATLVVSNSVDNIYTGGTIISNGLIEAVAATNALTSATPLGSGAVTLAGGGLVLQGNTNLTLGSGSGYAVTLTGNSSIAVDRVPGSTSVSNKLTIGSLNVGANALTVSNRNAYTLAVAGNMIWSNSTLSAGIVEAGNVLIYDTNRFGNFTNTVTGSGRYFLNGVYDSVNMTNSGVTEFSNSGNLVLNGILTNAQDGNAGRLVKVGAGAMFLTNLLNQEYSGGTIIGGGTLFAAGSSVVTSPLGSGGITLNGGTLNLLSDDSVTLGGTGYNVLVNSNGATLAVGQRSAGVANSNQVITLGALTLADGRNVTTVVSNAYSLLWSGAVNFTNNLYTANQGTASIGTNRFEAPVSFTGTNTNTGAALLVFNSTATFNSNAILTANATNIFNGAVNLNGTNVLAGSSAVPVQWNGTNSFDANSNGLLAVTVTGGLRASNVVLVGNSTISNTVNVLLNGLVGTNGVNSGTLIKLGAGNLFLTNLVNNTYDGGTILGGGTVFAAGSTSATNVFGTGNNVTFNGATLRLLSDSSNLTFGPVGAATNAGGYDLVFNSNSTISVDRQFDTLASNTILFVNSINTGTNVLNLVSSNGYLLGLNNVNVSNSFLQLSNASTLMFTNTVQMWGSNLMAGRFFATNTADGFALNENVIISIASNRLVSLNGLITNVGGTYGITVDGLMNFSAAVTNRGTLFLTNLVEQNFAGNLVLTNGGRVVLYGNATVTNPAGTGSIVLGGGVLELRTDVSQQFGPGSGYTINVQNDTNTIVGGPITTVTNQVITLGSLVLNGYTQPSFQLFSNYTVVFAAGLGNLIYSNDTIGVLNTTPQVFQQDAYFFATNFFGGSGSYTWLSNNYFGTDAITMSTNTGGLFWSNTISLNGTNVFSNASTAPMAFLGFVTNGTNLDAAGNVPAGWVKSGAGTLFITNSYNNSNSGTVVINAGAVTAGTTNTSLLNFTPLGVNTATNAVTLNGGTLNLRADTNVIVGPGQGYGVVVASNATINLATFTTGLGSNNYFQIGDLQTATNALATVSVANGMRLLIADNLISNESRVISGTVFHTNAVTFVGTNWVSGTWSFSNTPPAPMFLLSNNVTLIVPSGTLNLGGYTVSNADPLVLSGLTKDGTGTLTVNTNSTYGGPTVIRGGTYGVGSAGLLTAFGTNSSITLEGISGILGVAGQPTLQHRLDATATVGLGNGYDINVLGGNATIDLNRVSGAANPNHQFNNLLLSNAVLTVGGANSRLWFVGSNTLVGTAVYRPINGQDMTITGRIGESNGPAILVKAGGNNLILSNAAPTHSGGTIVEMGGLFWRPQNTAGANLTTNFGTGAIYVDGGATFGYNLTTNGGINFANDIYIGARDLAGANGTSIPSGGIRYYDVGRLDFGMAGGNGTASITNTGIIHLQGVLIINAGNGSYGTTTQPFRARNITIEGKDGAIWADNNPGGTGARQVVDQLFTDGETRNLEIRTANQANMEFIGTNSLFAGDWTIKQSYRNNGNGIVRFASTNPFPGGTINVEPGAMVSFTFNPTNLGGLAGLNTYFNFQPGSILSVDMSGPSNLALDFSATGMNRNVRLGAANGINSTLTNSGTEASPAITPFASDYKLGASGTLTLNGTNMLGGARRLLAGPNPFNDSVEYVTYEPVTGGTLIINQSNSFIGGTVVQSGTLQVGHSNALGNGRIDVYTTLQYLNNANVQGGMAAQDGLTNRNQLVLHPGSTLILDRRVSGLNNSNQFGDLETLALNGATFRYLGTNASVTNIVSEFITNVTFSGNARFSVEAQSITNNVWITVSNLVRASNGTFELFPNNGSAASMGTTNRLIVGNPIATTNGMVTPYIVHGPARSFVTYDPVTGFSNAAFTTTDIGNATSSAIVDVTGNTNIPAGVGLYALRMTSGTLSNTAVIITNISGGIIAGANTVTIQPRIDMNGAEALIFVNGNTLNLAASANAITNASTITKFGSGGNVTIYNAMTGYTNGWNINGGFINFSNAAAAGGTNFGNYIRMNGGLVGATGIRFNNGNDNQTYTSGRIYSLDNNTIAFDQQASDRNLNFGANGLELNSVSNGLLGSVLRLQFENRDRMRATLTGSLILNSDATLDVRKTTGGLSRIDVDVTGGSNRFIVAGNIIATNKTLTKIGNSVLQISSTNTTTATNLTIWVNAGALAVGANGSLGGTTNSVTTIRPGAVLELINTLTNFQPLALINQQAGSAERWQSEFNRFAFNSTPQTYVVSNGVNLQIANSLLVSTNKTIQLNGGSIEAYLYTDDGRTNYPMIGTNITIELAQNSKIGVSGVDIGRSMLTNGAVYLTNFLVFTNNARITGAGSLTKIGLDVVELGNTNSDWTGGTIINEGLLRNGANNVLPTNGLLTVTRLGDYELNGFSQIVSGLNSNGVVRNSAAAYSDLTIGGSVNSLFSGLIDGNVNLIKNGTGSFTLAGATNDYTGTNFILGGNLIAGASSLNGQAGSLGNGSSAILLGAASGSADAGFLIGASNVTIGREVVVQAGSSGTLSIGGTFTSGTSSFTNTITLNNNATLTAAPGGTVNFNAPISGTGNVTKSGGGTVVLNTTNNWIGSTLVSGGILQNGVINALPTNTDLTVTGGAYALNGFNQNVNGLVLNGGNVNGAGTLTSATDFDVRAGNVSAVLAGNVGLNKSTAGTVILSNNNTYTGGTAVSAGTLQNGINNALPTGTTVTVTGGAYSLSTYNQTVGGLVLNGGDVTGSGTLTSTTDFDVRAGNASANLAGSVGMIKTGAGEVVLSGVNTFTGNTTISNGTLTVSGGSAILNSTTVNVESGGTFKLNSSETIGGLNHTTATGGTVNLQANTLTVLLTNGAYNQFEGTITGTGGGLTVNGGGTGGTLVLTNTGGNTFTGTTTVENEGNLNLASDGALGGTATVVLNSGGTLMLSGSSSMTNRINDSAALNLNGGKLATMGLSEAVGSLTLSASSTIDLGTGASVLSFADGTYSAGTLSILNWSGDFINGGGTDQLRFTTQLSDTFLANINFDGFGPGAKQLNFGTYWEVTPVPEPSTWVAIVSVSALLGYRERRRLTGLLKRRVRK